MSEFDGEIFRQILGTAVGTPMAPSIANVFMGWQQLFSQSPGHVDTSLWKRFIDDIVMLWFKGEQQLLDFMDGLNDQHSTIKFTANYGTVDLYTISGCQPEYHRWSHFHRPSHQGDSCTYIMYLPFTSCHPCHCIRSIPYSQCLCIRQICSDNNTFEKRCQALKKRLVKRRYP